jgi:glucose-6-phosphate 1-dehydrogenase
MHCYGDFFDPAPTVGYESLIYDCMMGDPTLFQSFHALSSGSTAAQLASMVSARWNRVGSPIMQS